MYLSFLRTCTQLTLKKWLAILWLFFLIGCEDQTSLRNSNQQATQSVTRMTEFGPGTTDPSIPSHTYIDNPHAINEGKRLYAWFNCIGCHANGGGGMGPPLIDDAWIYGSKPANIYSSIMEGRPNGMPAFYGKIPEQEVWKIVAYVRSLSELDDNLPKEETSKSREGGSSEDEEKHVTHDFGAEQE